MFFDTASSNTGYNSGTCDPIKKNFKEEEEELLSRSRAWKYHIMVLIISIMFKICIGIKSSPEDSLFKCFQEYRSLIDIDKYKPRISFDDVENLEEDMKQEMIKSF